MSMSKFCPLGCGNRCDTNSKSCGACRRDAQRVEREIRLKAKLAGVDPVMPAPPVPAPEAVPTVAGDRERARLRSENTRIKDLYNQALGTIDNLERDLAGLNILSQGLDPIRIEPKLSSGKNEGTVVVLASDWHIEENVDPRKVNGLNEFTVDIAKDRAQKFFRTVVRLTNLLQKDLSIKHLVLALLGDFITNDIHEECADVTELGPTHAIVAAENMIIGGINYILENTPTDFTLTIPCHSGNHGRVTKTSRFSNENAHSLEYLMYRLIASHFRNDPRVKFMIAEGPHSFMEIYSQKIRFHHGHMIRYQGGVGGITIPVNKAIGQWNKANKVDLDVFGHYHQYFDGGNFICNGSLIGYNAFALSIKASYEPPKQALFLIDKKHGRTCNWPIYFTSK